MNTNNNNGFLPTTAIGDKLLETMRAFYSALPGETLVLAGPSGAGKSEIVQQYAKEMGMPLFTIYGSQVQDQFHIVIPMPDGSLKDVRPSQLISEADSEPIILFMDELNHMDNRAMKMMYGLMLDHKIGSFELPKGSIIIAARNGKGDGANSVQGKIPAPVTNRVCTMEVIVGKDEVVTHFKHKDVDHRVIAFLRTHPEVIHNFTNGSDEMNFPTPRSWMSVNSMMEIYDKQPGLFNVLSCGKIGESTSFQFQAFLEIMGGLPSMKKILKGKETVVITETKLAWGFLGMVEAISKDLIELTDDEVANLIDYINAQQLVKEISALTFTALIDGLTMMTGTNKAGVTAGARMSKLGNMISQMPSAIGTKADRRELNHLMGKYK